MVIKVQTQKFGSDTWRSVVEITLTWQDQVLVDIQVDGGESSTDSDRLGLAEKSIPQTEQIHFKTWTNIFCNVDKFIF